MKTKTPGAPARIWLFLVVLIAMPLVLPGPSYEEIVARSKHAQHQPLDLLSQTLQQNWNTRLLGLGVHRIETQCLENITHICYAAYDANNTLLGAAKMERYPWPATEANYANPELTFFFIRKPAGWQVTSSLRKDLIGFGQARETLEQTLSHLINSIELRNANIRSWEPALGCINPASVQPSLVD